MNIGGQQFVDYTISLKVNWGTPIFLSPIIAVCINDIEPSLRFIVHTFGNRH